jgi:hypothetical protein
MDSPDWVDYCLYLIISRKEREAREKRDEELRRLLRPQDVV